MKSLLFLLLLIFPVVSHAQFTLVTNFDNGTIAITGYTGSNGVVVVPSTISYLPVTSISDWAFYATSVTNIIVPDTVTTIGEGAFFGCQSLTNITLGSGVANIAAAAFINCSSVTNITLPDDLTTVQDITFSGCSSLAQIIIPANVTSIGDYVFDNCINLTGIFFRGNAPGAGADPFDPDPITAYYLPQTSGWNTFVSIPTAPWL